VSVIEIGNWNKLELNNLSMMISISHNKKIIQSKEVIYTENKDALTWMIKAFKENFGIDINNYSLQQLKQSSNSILIEISNEDLKKWRNDRLRDLGI